MSTRAEPHDLEAGARTIAARLRTERSASAPKADRRAGLDKRRVAAARRALRAYAPYGPQRPND